MEFHEQLGMNVGDESAVWGMQRDAEWRNAWSRLIAYAWMNEDNLQEAINSPIETMFKLSDYVTPPGLFLRIRAASRDANGNQVEIVTPEYPKVMWNIKDGELVRHVISEGGGINLDYKYNPEEIGKRVNGWSGFEENLPTDIILTLPPKPEDTDINTYALTDYQATGKTFPFTS